MSKHFSDLPREIMLEIFTFLSLPHLGTLLSLNRSIHDELENSSNFWRKLWNGYSKGVEHYSIPLDLSDSMKKQFVVLISHKKQDIIFIKNSIRRLRRDLDDCEVMIEIGFSDPNDEMIDSYREKAKEIKNEIDECQAKLEILKTDSDNFGN
ncbi:hypothetical protein NAEGRDRAFT_65077 [Naegleria gruberi]|uniref:F-box domain-containing protein n=1 Tax=Naegleria gruberi TaxID=5762 RepID=D2V897_NAEGR|nr:uncharacterized protein NAEGRDRAFT_65077 [Naegleria gruberi]EFC47006.1 hypothetical protein NAEGRDRAFT_65077 [Naegleria gruberi]|eukprot:XP_002679750.1 hypothetical protein NAEGRDRAFT_65077 [Naegleria gruberi strain NEG-M]